MSGFLVLGRAWRVLLLAGLVFAALPGGSALADTIVGQTGTPRSDLVGGDEIVQTSAAMPAAGVVTSFQTQSSKCNLESGTYNFQVLRPLGSDQYRVLGDTGAQNDPCDSKLHSYAVSIPVQAGDVIGLYVVNAWQGLLDVGGSGAASATGFMTEPVVGQTVTLTDDPPRLALTIDESATLTGVGGPPPPTSKAQCKHGGWRSFGTLFKNQGDCVAFVASGGKNPPSGKGSLGAAPDTVCQSGCRYDDLQSAIEAVENGTITNPITVGPGDYTQTNAFVRGTVAIRGVGDGSNGTILDGVEGAGPVIDLAKPGNLTISGVEILDGNNDEGGGIFNGGAAVTFDGPVSITNNAASVSGGGIFNAGGTVNFDAGSTVSITSNTAHDDGGGILNDGGTVNFVLGSTVSITNNTAHDDGGGIFNDGGTVNFVPSSNVSITGNTPDNCVGTTSCP